MVKGRIGYLPKEWVIELENTKNMYHIDKDSEAFHTILNDLHFGRELKKILKK